MIRYYADQLYKVIKDEVIKDSSGDKRLQFVVSDLGFEDSLCLFTQCNNLADAQGLKLRFWLAEEYKDAWSGKPLGDLSDHFANGNLTQYRNEIEPGSILILVGTAHVSDKGSLSDFFHCDGLSLWQDSMSGTFTEWIDRLFTQYDFAGVGADERQKLDGVLKYLREAYSIQMVSDFLGEFGIAEEDEIPTPKELLVRLLRNLKRFSLPDLSGFVDVHGSKKTFRYYANAAVSFFNYDMFIEEKNRSKYLKAIQAFREQGTDFDFDPFASKDDYLKALEQYVGKFDTTNGAGFLAADFVFLYDVVLRARPPKVKKVKNTLHKLAGSPAEVVLTAIWKALGEYRSECANPILKVRLQGVCFVHDLEGGGTEDDIREFALGYLKRLLGGLDEMLSSQIQLGNDDGPLPIEASLLNDDIATRAAKSGEPYFEFHVVVADADGIADEEALFRSKFAIRLPSDHPMRQAIGLFDCTREFLSSSTGACKLPVFHFQFYRELMMARDTDEIRRVLNHCLTACDDPTKFGTMLMTPEWWDEPSTAAAKPYFLALTQSYSNFVGEVCEKGLYKVLALGGETPQLFNAYSKLAEGYVEKDPALEAAHKLAAMFMRAFLVVEQRPGQDVNEWSVKEFEPSAIVTVLHPAMLEMLQAQLVFLFSSFSRIVSRELTCEEHAFAADHWSYYLDMAEMKMPITGMRVNSAGCFEVCTAGDRLLHKVGKVKVGAALASTRFLTRYDRVDEEEISDAELFRPSSESRHLFRMMKEYHSIHVGARDGVSLAVYRNEDIQPVLAAVDQYVKWLADEKRNGLALAVRDRPRKYAIKLTFFSESSDTSEVSTFLNQWQDRVNDAEEGEDLYAMVNFDVSHRVVTGADSYKQFAKIIRAEVDADIFVFYNFIKPGIDGCDFQAVDAFDLTKADIKFPILEQSQCAGQTVDMKARRSQIVSNRQFRLSADHVEVAFRVREKGVQGLHHVVLATGDFAPWKDVIDAAHASSEWVVCVDALIDKALLALGTDEAPCKRELIGFGSGVGLHGEHNYTISTQKYTLEAIRKKLLASMKGVYHDGYGYSQGSEKQLETIADCLLKESKELAGISLIRSLGPSEYVRDFMAYSLMHRILPLDEDHHLCDRIFSVDAYSHWFDQASEDDQTHPDLLWLRADYAEDGALHLDIKLIECKMAKQSDAHLEKATAQIKNGLRVLTEVFRPKGSVSLSSGNGFGGGDRPDMRYWCLQLHRMIASSVNIDNPKDMPKYLNAMERLASGEFEIEWGGGIFTFWTDSVASDLSCAEHKSIDLGATSCDVPVFESGSKFVYRLCANEVVPTLTWGQSLSVAPAPDDEMPNRNPVNESVAEDESDQPFDFSSAAGETEGAAPVADMGETPVQDDPPVAGSTGPHVANASETTGSVVSSTEQSSVPDRVLLGKTVDGRKDVYWEFGHPKLNNRHFLIFGNSGMGKTYAIQAILCELAKKGQNSLIVDYTNGFLPNQIQPLTGQVLAPAQHIVKTDKLPINPFTKQMQDIGDGVVIPDSDLDVAKRVASIFDSVYALGDQQISILIDAIQETVEREGESADLDGVLDTINAYNGDGIHSKPSVVTLASKLKPFISEKPFKGLASIGWADLFADAVKRCHVFQMVKIDKSTARILTEFILWDLYAYVCSTGNEKNPRVVVLDEVQNLDQRLESPLGKYLTEGRKFGLAVMSATQTLSNLQKDEQARLFQAGHKLFFRPADPEINQYTDFVMQAAGYGTKKEWSSLLTSLSKGECLSIGPLLDAKSGGLANGVHKIKIAALEERGF